MPIDMAPISSVTNYREFSPREPLSGKDDDLAHRVSVLSAEPPPSSRIDEAIEELGQLLVYPPEK